MISLLMATLLTGRRARSSVNRRSLALPLKLQWRPLHALVAPNHAMRQRLRLTIGKGAVRPPPVTDLVWVCADDVGDVALRLPHNFVPLVALAPSRARVCDAERQFLTRCGSCASRRRRVRLRMRQMTWRISRSRRAQPAIASSCSCAIARVRWPRGYPSRAFPWCRRPPRVTSW